MQKRKLFTKLIDFDDKSITLKNTSIIVKPYELGTSLKLERSLCVWNEIYHRVEMIGMDYNKETKTLYLPRTTNVNPLEKLMGVTAEKDFVSDKSGNVKFNMKAKPRDEIQVEALNFLLGKGKHINNQYYSRLLLSLDTGFGKTFCAIAYIHLKKKKSAIIVPDDALLKRWHEGILEYTDIDEEDIIVLKGKKSIKDIIDNKGVDGKIILISHRTLNKYGNSNGWEEITKLFKYLNIGVKVFDECHKEFRNIVKIDLYTNTEKTIYLTATAARSTMKENKIYKNIFLSIPQLVMSNNSREQNHINMAILCYNSMPTTASEYICKTVKGFSMIQYMKYCMGKGRNHFLKAIDVFIKSTVCKEGKILIMVGLIDMIFFLKEYLLETYPELTGEVGIYCSKATPDEKKDAIENKKIVITTYKSLGTGVDIPDLKFICMAEPYSSEITAKQCSGRLRHTGWYFEIVDIGFKDCKRQFEHRKKHLIRKANKFKIIEL